MSLSDKIYKPIGFIETDLGYADDSLKVSDVREYVKELREKAYQEWKIGKLGLSVYQKLGIWIDEVFGEKLTK